MLGAGGTGMRNLAFLLREGGAPVFAADANQNAAQKIAALRGTTVIGEAEAHARIADVNLVVYSDALPQDHGLLEAARAGGKHVLSYHEMVARLAGGKKLVAVAGTHGKSSTAAMLARILIDADLDPTVLLGADVLEWQGRGARAGKGAFFVVEADEYRNHFLSYTPAHVVITSIDFDHPDYFSSLAAVRQSFSAFLRRLAPGGSVVTLPAVKAAHPDLPWPNTTQVAARERLVLRVPGDHMLDNAALAKAMAVTLGVPAQAATASLENFVGLSRRAEIIGDFKGMIIVSDYGHHPTAIAATYAALRGHYPGKRIAVLFEPHTVSRLAALPDEFAASLAATDGVVLAPVFIPPGREQETQEAATLLAFLAEKLQKKKVYAHILPSYDGLPSTLTELAHDFDVVVAFTAGVLDEHLRRLVSKG